MGFSGLSAGLQTIKSLVQFPVREQAWVAGQVSSRGGQKATDGDFSPSLNRLMFPSLSFSLPSPLSKNK